MKGMDCLGSDVPARKYHTKWKTLDSSLARIESIELGKYLVDKRGKLGRLDRPLNGRSLFEFIESRTRELTFIESLMCVKN